MRVGEFQRIPCRQPKPISDIPGADINVSGAASIEAMFADHDFSIELMGKETDTLQEIGNEMTEQIKQLDVVDTAELDITEGNPEIQVVIDRKQLAAAQ